MILEYMNLIVPKSAQRIIGTHQKDRDDVMKGLYNEGSL